MAARRHFIGAAFEDSLFHIDNNLRETACSWKIMSSITHFGALANDTWRWRAVGIPLNLLDRSLQGDIDLLVAMLLPPEAGEGRRGFPPPVYRCFELKTAKVTRDGDVKSLKTNQFHKTMGQLEKLCDIGAQQVFLLETFIVEAGYSSHGQALMPPRVREAVASKYGHIMRADYGYVAMAIEQIPGFAEAATAVFWPTVTVKKAETRQPSRPFLDIINMIEAYVDTSGASRFSDVITYCTACQKLTHCHRTGPYSCRECRLPFI
jgi:hypothetical protein